jgi:pilus assembly protein CpaF
MKDNMSSAFSGNISEVESVLATSNILVTNVTNDVGILSCFNDVLRKIMEEEDVNEVMINGIKNIYIERDGVVCELGSSVSDDEISRFIDSVSLFNSRNIDINHPIFDGKIPGGFRCNVVIPPVSLDGAIITLRKHRPSLGNFDLLLDNATLSSDMVEFLVDAVKEKKNIIIAGGTGSGKTTLLNVMLNSLKGTELSNERIVSIEDTAELAINLSHVIRLEAKMATPDCRNEVSIRDLVKTALRMRPDRIILGEVRGEEAYDLLHAINTGHKGSICTIHANSCRDALRRLEILSVLGHPNIDISVPRSWIASNIDLVVYISRTGALRKLSEIKKIEGLECGNYVLHDVP